MRVIDVFITVLTSIGILGSSTAEVNTWLGGEGFLTILRNECDKHGEPKSYDILIEKFEYASSCIKSLGNITEQLKSEISYTQTQKNLDPVFKEYCRKNLTFHECVEHVIAPLKSCVRHHERENINNLHSVIESFVNYFCESDGYRADEFIVEDGLECLASRQPDLGTCAEKTIGNYIQSSDATYSTMNEESCKEVDKFRNCVLEAMEECVEISIPVRTIDSLFKHLLKKARCKEFVGYEESESTLSEEEQRHNIRKRVKNFWKHKCARNGGPEAFNSVYLGVSYYGMCVLGAMNGRSSIRSFHSSGLTPFAKTYCNELVSDHQKCEEVFIDTLKRCLDPEERETADVVRKMGNALREFVCRNDAEAITEFVQPTNMQCFYSNRKRLVSCFKDVFVAYRPSVMERLVQPIIINGQDCSKMEKLQYCVFEMLEECKNEKLSSVFDALFSFMTKQTPCERLF